jgi:hypothetical protein
MAALTLESILDSLSGQWNQPEKKNPVAKTFDSQRALHNPTGAGSIQLK